jgi:hypothetical protein
LLEAFVIQQKLLSQALTPEGLFTQQNIKEHFERRPLTSVPVVYVPERLPKIFVDRMTHLQVLLKSSYSLSGQALLEQARNSIWGLV